MTQKYSHSPHSPQSVAQSSRSGDSTQSPRPLCNRAGRVTVCVCARRVNQPNQTGRVDVLAGRSETKNYAAASAHSDETPSFALPGGRKPC